jgi:hypothetical protein
MEESAPYGTPSQLNRLNSIRQVLSQASASPDYGGPARVGAPDKNGGIKNLIAIQEKMLGELRGLLDAVAEKLESIISTADRPDKVPAGCPVAPQVSGLAREIQDNNDRIQAVIFMLGELHRRIDL